MVTITYGTASNGTAMKGILPRTLPTRKLFAASTTTAARGAEEPDRHPLDQEWPADEPVGRPHQLHDLHFALAGEDGETDGVGDEQNGHDARAAR